MNASTKSTKSESSSILFRFPLSKDTTELIFEFSKIHQYDDRKQYKEEWHKWIQIDDIKEQIDIECERLKSQGFSGNITNKLFVSARYYYRNMTDIPTHYKPETVSRKEYTTTSKPFLKIMDNWILNRPQPRISPSKQYIEFCEENQTEIQLEILRSHQPAITFNKVFCNREYVLHRQNQINSTQIKSNM